MPPHIRNVYGPDFWEFSPRRTARVSVVGRNLSKVSLLRLVLEMFIDLSLAKVVRVVLFSHYFTLFWSLYFTLTTLLCFREMDLYPDSRALRYMTFITLRYVTLLYFTLLYFHQMDLSQEARARYFTWPLTFCFYFIAVLDLALVPRGSRVLLHLSFIKLLTLLCLTLLSFHHSTRLCFYCKRLLRATLLNVHHISLLYCTSPHCHSITVLDLLWFRQLDLYQEALARCFT